VSRSQSKTKSACVPAPDRTAGELRGLAVRLGPPAALRPQKVTQVMRGL
jgi:hypothetical protein